MTCKRCEQLGNESACDPKVFCKCIPSQTAEWDSLTEKQQTEKIKDISRRVSEESLNTCEEFESIDADSPIDVLNWIEENEGISEETQLTVLNPIPLPESVENKSILELILKRGENQIKRVRMRDTILMCHPSEFNVSYVINPWMKDHVANSDHGLAMEQWNILSQKVASVSNLNVMWQAAGLPDMVFTANAGLVIGSHFVPSRFKHHERSGEEQFFIDWFKQEGFNIVEVPDGIAFEGAGDALFDRQQMILWLGYGHRSDFEVAEFLWNELTLKTVSLNLIDDRFYHLDTCFCPLDDGYLMYYPGAFDLKSNELIESNVPFEKRIIVSEEDALNFACNAINTNYHIILNKASKDLRIKLESLFFVVQESSLTEFIKAGGSAKCLTIRLNEQHMLLDALCF